MRNQLSLFLALFASTLTAPVAADEVVIVQRHEERVVHPRKHRKHRKVVRRERIERRDHDRTKVVIEGR